MGASSLHIITQIAAWPPPQAQNRPLHSVGDQQGDKGRTQRLTSESSLGWT